MVKQPDPQLFPDQNKDQHPRWNRVLLFIVTLCAILFALLFYLDRQKLNTAQDNIVQLTNQSTTAEAAAQSAAWAQATAESLSQEAERAQATVAAEMSSQQSSLVATIAAQNSVALQLEQARSRELAAQAQAVLTTFPQRSLLLAIEALTSFEKSDALATQALYQALSTVGGVGLYGHRAKITAVAVTTDGRWLATSSEDGAVLLWDLSGPEPGVAPIVLREPDHAINALAISPDSRWLAAAGDDGVIYLWDLHQPNLVAASLVRPAYQYGVQNLTFTADNRWLITSSYEQTVYLWALSPSIPMEPTVILAGHQSQVGKIVVSPNGRWLFSTDSEQLLRWDLTAVEIAASMTPVTLLKRSPARVEISPDGHWLAVSSYDGRDSAIQLWDLTAANPTANSIPISAHLDGSVSALVFSNDGSRLAAAQTADGSRIYLWDLTMPDPGASSVILPTQSAGTLAFSPDNQWLLANNRDDNIIHLWHVSGREKIDLHGHEGPATLMTFSPDQKWLVTANIDPDHETEYNALRLWDWLATGRFLTQFYTPNRSSDLSITTMPFIFDKPENTITHLAISPDSRWLLVVDQRVCGGEGCEPPGDAAASLWDLQSGVTPPVPIHLFAQELKVQTAAMSADSRWLAIGGENEELWLWDLTTADPSQSRIALPGHTSQIGHIVFTPDGRWLITSGRPSWTNSESDNIVRLWKLDSITSSPTSIDLPAHEDPVSQVIVSTDNQWLITLSYGGPVYLWNLNDEDPSLSPIILEGLEISPPPSEAIAISPDNHWLASGGFWPNNSIRLSDLTASEPTAAPIILRFYEVTVQNTLVDEPFLSFSSDSRWLLSGRSWPGNPTELWDLAAADPVNSVRSLSCDNDHFMAFSPNRRWVLTGNCLWDISDPDQGVTPVYLYDHAGPIQKAVFSPDSQHLAAVNFNDDLIYIWDLSASDPNETTIILSQTWVDDVVFSPDGRWLIVASEETRTSLWNLDLNELVDLACRTAGRNFTRQEWYQYFDNTPYRLTCPQFPAGQ